MRLTFFPTSGMKLDIRPAPSSRAWMDATPQSFAYRCLPLNIANAHGWELLSPCSFDAVWTGGARGEDVRITPAGDGDWPGLGHFGSGVLTFHTGYLIRTEPGWDLWVGGPVNAPKDGISPLAGIIETDWAPYSFTMNWLFTRPWHVVRFAKGEPFCHMFPVQRGAVEAFEPEIRTLDDAPELRDAHQAWTQGRDKFLADLPVQGSEAQIQKWEKRYYRGLHPDDTRTTAEHRTKLQLDAPVDRTAEPRPAAPKPD